MNPDEILEVVNYFPRGSRGSTQNIFRSGFYNALRNAYGRKSQLPRDIEMICTFVVDIIRREVDPSFVPAMD